MRIFLKIIIICLLVPIDLICQCADDPYVGVSVTKLQSGLDFCKINQYDGPITVNSCSTIGGDWMLVIDDEFNGPHLDSTIWIPRMGWSNDDGSKMASLIGLKIPQNISFSNGYLKLRGNYDPNPNKKYDYWAGNTLQGQIHRDYTSAGISSLITFPLNSRYQINGKAFPEANGNWSAFWLFGDQGEEIDVFEVIDGVGSQDDYSPTFFQKMTYHSKQYGSLGTTRDEGVERFTSTVDLSNSYNQYDLIWDKYKIQWWFNGNIVHQIAKFHYCPSTWTQNHVKNHFRKNPMYSYSAMSPHVGHKFAINKYYPENYPVNILLDFDIRNNTTTNYTAQKTMDIDYIRVWLRAECHSNHQVSQMNYISQGFWNGQSISGTTYELGGWVNTNPNSSITVLGNHHCFYVATNEVALLNGFGAENGSIFSAYISSCGNAWDARMSNPDDDGSSVVDSTNNEAIEDLSESENVRLNYATERVMVESDQNVIVSYELYDVSGNLIEKKDVNSNSFSIQDSNYAKGIYLLKLYKTDGITFKKVFL